MYHISWSLESCKLTIIWIPRIRIFVFHVTQQQNPNKTWGWGEIENLKNFDNFPPQLNTTAKITGLKAKNNCTEKLQLAPGKDDLTKTATKGIAFLLHVDDRK